MPHLPFSILAFLAITLFAVVHLYADKTNTWRSKTRGKFLSMGGSIALTFVFISLLPKLAYSDLTVSRSLAGIFPYFEKHVYVMALAGFLFFLIAGRSREFLKGKGSFYFSMIAYAVFNFSVGYAIVDKNNPEIKPLLLFTLAMALHYFTTDFALSESYPNKYRHFEKWILIGCLYFGWVAGFSITISSTAIALVSAFLAGGMMVNVMSHEMNSKNPNNLWTFLITAVLYTAILLALGR